MIQHIRRLILPCILLLVFGFGTYRLSESPAIWGDEGMLIELAVNLARHGVMENQVAPNTFFSAAFMTTGFPVIYPVAASLKLFGVGLLQARAVMVVYMLLCIAAIYLFAKRIGGRKNAAFATLLVATFPPFYGNGKNVLGEIPALFFLFSFFFCTHLLETSDGLKSGSQKRRTVFFLAGLTAGLCLVTKPIFLTLLPAIVGGAILARKKIERDAPSFVLFAFGLIAPILFWFKTQFFPGDSAHDILSMYANPYQLTDISTVILQNIPRFFRESSPLYLLGMFVVWSLSFLPRLWKDLRTKPRPNLLTLTESMSYVFCALIMIGYLRTPGWYRYFFPAQIIAMVYLPVSLRSLFGRIRRLPFIPVLILSTLILFQAYQTAFHSWVATTYRGTMTRDFQTYFKTVDPHKSFFIFPELVVFLPNDNYFQYLYVVGFKFGEEQLDALARGIPDVLITYSNLWDARDPTFSLYEEKQRIGRYVIAERRK